VAIQSLISGFTRFLGPASNAFYYVKMVMFYQSYIKMPFSVEIKEFQLFRHTHIDETSFMIEEINEWPEGVNISKGFISKTDKRHPYNKKENGCWYVFLKGMMQ
jgi:hypothetical protein